MGTWGRRPWDNDHAADWFGDLFDANDFRAQVRKTLELEAQCDTADQIRAAASMVVLLGRVYVWPIDHYDADLKLAIDKLTALLAVYPFDSPLNADYRAALLAEIELLEARRDHRAPSPAALAWWTELAEPRPDTSD